MKHLTLNRRHALGLVAAPLLVGLTGTSFAQKAWPSKTIRLVVPFPPGGPTDTASRIVAQDLSERLKNTVIVENRAGASGSIAATQVTRSAPDGYTLMMLATPTMLAPHLYQQITYDTVKDFTPVATVYDLPIVIVVNPDLLPDVNDLEGLIAHAKSEKLPMNYTSSGAGSFGHLSMELLQEMAGFDMEHIPYGGGVPAITDTIGGQVPIMYADLVAALPHIKAGKLRAIAVGSPERVSMLPDVKTIAEQGVTGYDAVSWGGLLAPLGTPDELVQRIAAEVKEILADPAVQERLLGAGAIARFQSPAELEQRLQSDYERWGQIIRDKDIAP